MALKDLDTALKASERSRWAALWVNAFAAGVQLYLFSYLNLIGALLNLSTGILVFYYIGKTNHTRMIEAARRKLLMGE